MDIFLRLVEKGNMTRNELELREKIILNLYHYNRKNEAIRYIAQLYERNKKSKLYRFRKVAQHEIDAIRDNQIYLCKPRVYEDDEDCQWIDDLEALTKNHVELRSREKYIALKNLFTDAKYKEISCNIKQNPKYISQKEEVRNMCLIACITDKKTEYMWDKYATNSEGICMEYEFIDVIEAIDKLGIKFAPVRYVENRAQVKDIQFGPKEYAEDVSPELMIRKYFLSCMTKEKVPYSRESEWRVLCEKVDIPLEKDGRLFDFAKPSKIYMGKNIFKNKWFEDGIKEVAKEQEIVLVQEK